MRFKLLKNGKDLSDDNKRKIFNIKNDNQIIGLAYEMKESLVQLYDYLDVSVAYEHVKHWLSWVDSEGD